jgi:hypothetical protein
MTEEIKDGPEKEPAKAATDNTAEPPRKELGRLLVINAMALIILVGFMGWQAYEVRTWEKQFRVPVAKVTALMQDPKRSTAATAELVEYTYGVADMHEQYGHRIALAALAVTAGLIFLFGFNVLQASRAIAKVPREEKKPA